MKKSNLYGLLPTVAAALALMLSTSCGENDTPTPKPEPKPGPNPTPEEAVHHYAFAANVDNAVYITTFEDFKEGLKTDFKGAIKLASGTTSTCSPAPCMDRAASRRSISTP